MQEQLDFSVFDNYNIEKDDCKFHCSTSPWCSTNGPKGASVCSECKSSQDLFIDDPTTGDTICTNCGLIVHQLTDTQTKNYSVPEGGVIFSTNNDDMLFSNETQLSTSIGNHSNNNFKAKKLQRYHNFTKMSSKDYNLWVNYTIIENFCNQLNISNIICTTAKLLYKDMHSIKIKRGNVKKGFLLAIIYVSCKIHNCNTINHDKLINLVDGTARKFLNKNIIYVEKHLWTQNNSNLTYQRDINNNNNSITNALIYTSSEVLNDHVFYIIGFLENPPPIEILKSKLGMFGMTVYNKVNINSLQERNPTQNDNDYIFEKCYDFKPISSMWFENGNGFYCGIKNINEFINNTSNIITDHIDILPAHLAAALIYLYIIKKLQQHSLTGCHTQSYYKQYLKRLIAYSINTSLTCFHNKINLCNSILNDKL
tara:strand:+ start:1765 stop:3039 length:1275 start_codon:yes stop_codon:yes gene_type:complete